MSEAKRFVTYRTPSRRTGEVVLNLVRMRFETVATQDPFGGTIRTLQSGRERLHADGAPAPSELPLLFIQNLIRLPFGRKTGNARRAA